MAPRKGQVLGVLAFRMKMSFMIKNDLVLLDEKHVAAYLGVSVHALRRWRFEGRGPRFIHVGGWSGTGREMLRPGWTHSPAGGLGSRLNFLIRPRGETLPVVPRRRLKARQFGGTAIMSLNPPIPIDRLNVRTPEQLQARG